MQWDTSERPWRLQEVVEAPALAALPGCLLVLVVEFPQELRGFFLVPPHQLLQLLELTSLLLLVDLGLLQSLHFTHRDVCSHRRGDRICSRFWMSRLIFLPSVRALNI